MRDGGFAIVVGPTYDGATMTKSIEAAAIPEADLSALRREIDAIDLALHEGLIARGAIVDRLIAAKAAAGGGSAFRPAREAAMMRALVERHRGILPLDTVEGIWRIIISTFTFVQARYTVHADVSGGDAPMRDGARFHFGFTVPLVTHGSAAAVVAAVAAAKGDLGLVRAAGGETAWWDALRAPDAPKIIARLPFVERVDHAAGLPLFVVAKPLADAAPHDVLLHAATLPHARPRPGGPVAIVAEAPADVGVSYLLAAPGTVTAEALAIALQAPGAPTPVVAFVGSHAARYEVDLGLAATANPPA